MARLDGVAAAAIGAGALLIYAGAKGYSVPAAVANVIRGTAPGTGQSSSALATAMSTGGASPNTTSSADVVTGSASRTQWAAALLAVGGWPQTTANRNSVIAWQNREGGGGANNPLNTTLPMPGATDFNSVGVKNYTSIQQGLEATVQTLTGGGYGDIVMALASGQGLCGRSFTGLSLWSGGGGAIPPPQGYASVC